MILKRNCRRALAMAMAAIQLTALVAVVPQGASAAQITSRSVQLSDNTSAQPNVTYTFTFTPQATTNIGSIGFEFCSTDPLMGTTCTLPTSMSTLSATLGSVTGQGASNGGFTLNNSNNGYPYLTRTAVAGIAAATTVTLQGITNPTNTNDVTYYARILTFAGTAPSPVNATSDNSSTDFGGVAFEVGDGINVQAKVQEQLNFCTYVTGTCTVPTSSAVNLGTLSTANVNAGSSTLAIGTNAQNGVTVQYFGTTLTSGTNTLAPAGAQAAISAGTTKYGINLASGNAGWKDNSGATFGGGFPPSGSAPIASVTSTFNTANQVAFVVNPGAVSGNNPASPNAQTVVAATAPVNQGVFTVNYAASIDNLAKPGVYTSTVQYVATGVF